MEHDDISVPGSAGRKSTGAQTVERAIDILELVAEGPILLPQIAERLGMSSTTCYRLATTLADRGLLIATARSGYRLGPLLQTLANKIP